MGQVVYYAATSLDGKIAGADKENPVKWLDKFNDTLAAYEDGDLIKESYNNFMQDVSMVICGSTTYNDIKGFGIGWPYEQDSYVVTSKKDYKDENIKGFVSIDEIKTIIQQAEGKVYLLGGGALAAYLIDQKLVDKVILTVMPIILGEGIDFFQSINTHDLTLDRVTTSGDFVELEYTIINT